MDLGRPFALVTPTVDGDVLAALAGADASFTPPALHRLIGRHSVDGIRRSLTRLSDEGIVSGRQVGRAIAYELNRNHLAAPYVLGIAGLRGELLDRLTDLIEGWVVPPDFAALFGSGATGKMRHDSDLDIFVVRPQTVEADDDGWRRQLDGLAVSVTTWTGNDARVLELGALEVVEGLRSGVARVLSDIRDEGLHLAGPRRYLFTVPLVSSRVP